MCVCLCSCALYFPLSSSLRCLALHGVQNWLALRDWVRSNGGFVSDSVGVGYFTGAGGGWGLKAIGALDVGEVLLKVPDSLLLTAERVLQEKPEWGKLSQVLDVRVLLGCVVLRLLAYLLFLCSLTTCWFVVASQHNRTMG
jgi:hypothetical protein